jgi:hypothetical protein
MDGPSYSDADLFQKVPEVILPKIFDTYKDDFGATKQVHIALVVEFVLVLTHDFDF